MGIAMGMGGLSRAHARSAPTSMLGSDRGRTYTRGVPQHTRRVDRGQPSGAPDADRFPFRSRAKDTPPHVRSSSCRRVRSTLDVSSSAPARAPRSSRALSGLGRRCQKSRRACPRRPWPPAARPPWRPSTSGCAPAPAAGRPCAPRRQSGRRPLRGQALPRGRLLALCLLLLFQLFSTVSGSETH